MGQRQLKSIARKEAMDNFSSAELLDQLLVVVSARSWILLVVIGSVLLAGAVWGFAGSIKVQIDGIGIIIERNAPLRIANPTATGLVINRKVTSGEVVEAGSELLSIGSPTTQNNLVEARKQLNTLIEQDKIETAQEEESLTKLKASLNLQRSAAEASIERTRTLLTLYDKLVKDFEELSKQKLIPNSKLISARSTLFSTEENEKTLLANLANFKSQLQIQLAQTTAARSQRISQIQTAKSTLTIAESNQTLNSIVTAPFRCRIVSMMVNIGDFITPGTDIFLVVPQPPASDTSTDPLQAIGFVQYGMGKEVKPGMRVEVAIPFAKSTEYGYIKGRVSTVATFASDEAMVVQRVGSDSLGREIVNSTSGVPLELIIDLEADPSTKSGFAWTSADGFPGVIPQLSECTINVTTHSERPIDLVIPWFKQIIGIDTAPEISGSS